MESLLIKSTESTPEISLDNENATSKMILKKSLYKTKRKLDILGLKEQFKIFEIGTDLFDGKKEAEAYA